MLSKHGWATLAPMGLDPAIHHFRKKMDARVEPAHDVEREVQFDRKPL
jgi:hypothetical protein